MQDALRVLDAVDMPMVFNRQAVGDEKRPFTLARTFPQGSQDVTGGNFSSGRARTNIVPPPHQIPSSPTTRCCRNVSNSSEDDNGRHFSGQASAEQGPQQEFAAGEDGVKNVTRHWSQHERFYLFRQVLEGAALAQGTEATLNLLRDPKRRPHQPVWELLRELMNFTPHTPSSLDEQLFAQNLRSSRRGTAAGPSGMTNEQLRLLSSPRDVHLLLKVGEQLARPRLRLSRSKMSA